MIDENNNCVTKPKLTITVSLFSKYNERSRLAAKQTNKQTYSETQKLVNIYAENILNVQNAYLEIDAQADLL